MPTDSIKNHGKYLEQLTWLRGIAAFLVIVSHTVRATEVSYLDGSHVGTMSIFNVLDLGTFGVILFFVLSGCTLYISNSNKMVAGYIWRFYCKRIFRIWPAYLVSLFMYIAFRPIFSALYPAHHGVWIEDQFLESFTASDLAAYLALTFNISGPSGLFNNAYWSLPVEFQYYIVFPLIILALRFAGFLGPILFAIGLYFLPKYGLTGFDQNKVFTLAFSFCGGVIVGHIYQCSTFRLSKGVGVVVIGMLFAVASALTNQNIKMPDLPIISNIWNWYGGLGIAVVFVALTTTMHFPRRLETAMKRFGDISYSTYLYHNLVIAGVVLVFTNAGMTDSGIRTLMTLVIALLGTYLLASLSHRWIEIPGIRIGRHLAARNLRSSRKLPQTVDQS